MSGSHSYGYSMVLPNHIIVSGDAEKLGEFDHLEVLWNKVEQLGMECRQWPDSHLAGHDYRHDLVYGDVIVQLLIIEGDGEVLSGAEVINKIVVTEANLGVVQSLLYEVRIL